MDFNSSRVLFCVSAYHYCVVCDRDKRSVCSNPGQPCPCHGRLIRRRIRLQPSSSHPHAAAAAVKRSASTVPLLPPPNSGHKCRGHKYRGHANAGASYSDSIGDTTYVFTTIPVPDHVIPVKVVRRWGAHPTMVVVQSTRSGGGIYYYNIVITSQ